MAPTSSNDPARAVHPLIQQLRAAAAPGHPLQASDVDAIEKALAAPNPVIEDLQGMAASIQHYLRDNNTPIPREVFTQLPAPAQNALVTLQGLADAPMRIHPRDAQEAATFLIHAMLNASSGTGSHEPPALNEHGLRALDLCIGDLRGMLDLAKDYDLDDMQQQSLLTAIETLELRKRWKAAPEAAQ